MTDQLDLIPQDGEAHARRSDPATSKDAADALEGEVATRMELKVLAALRNSPNGATTHELVGLTGLPYESVTPRIKPLRKKGLVEDSGAKRPGPGGKRQCIVWCLTPTHPDLLLENPIYFLRRVVIHDD